MDGYGSQPLAFQVARWANRLRRSCRLLRAPLRSLQPKNRRSLLSLCISEREFTLATNGPDLRGLFSPQHVEVHLFQGWPFRERLQVQIMADSSEQIAVPVTEAYSIVVHIKPYAFIQI
jgi:hypothetical protein